MVTTAARVERGHRGTCLQPQLPRVFFAVLRASPVLVSLKHDPPCPQRLVGGIRPAVEVVKVALGEGPGHAPSAPQGSQQSISTLDHQHTRPQLTLQGMQACAEPTPGMAQRNLLLALHCSMQAPRAGAHVLPSHGSLTSDVTRLFAAVRRLLPWEHWPKSDPTVVPLRLASTKKRPLDLVDAGPRQAGARAGGALLCHTANCRQERSRGTRVHNAWRQHLAEA